jgi:hypothetical protein
MGKGNTGRPSDIDAWRAQQYLDLQRRQVHIPSQRITWDMLSEDLQREISYLPVGYYSGDGSTLDTALDESGRVVFVPVKWGNSRYDMCVYGADVPLYGVARYCEATYGSYTPKTGKYDGTGGYGYVRYG